MENIIIETKTQHTELNYTLDIDEQRTSELKKVMRTSSSKQHSFFVFVLFFLSEGAVKSHGEQIGNFQHLSSRISKEENGGNGRETGLQRIEGNLKSSA